MATRIEGLDRLNQKLNALASGRVVRDSVDQAARYVKGQAIIYPPIRRQAQPFKTLKQQRWFFAALREGLITVPYVRRSMGGGLASRWVILRTDGGMGAEVTNSSQGGPYVMGKVDQSRYHEGNWKNETELVQDCEGPVLEIFRRNYATELNRK